MDVRRKFWGTRLGRAPLAFARSVHGARVRLDVLDQLAYQRDVSYLGSASGAWRVSATPGRNLDEEVTQGYAALGGGHCAGGGANGSGAAVGP